MKTKVFTLLFAFMALFVSVSKAEDLGWIERSSVGEILEQFGHKGMTVLSGTKTEKEDPEDGPGFYISARCKKDGKDYFARLWISSDWKRGRVISVKER